MKTVTVHRAVDVEGEPPIQPCSIVIGESAAEMTQSPVAGNPAMSLNTMAHVWNYEADAIANALFEHLPQAVGQRVLFRLMERYATNYIGGPRR